MTLPGTRFLRWASTGGVGGTFLCYPLQKRFQQAGPIVRTFNYLKMATITVQPVEKVFGKLISKERRVMF
jgi:hypothetical protein